MSLRKRSEERPPASHCLARSAGNFGPNGTTVDSAVYTSGGNASTQVIFTASNCYLSRPHVEVGEADLRPWGGSTVGSLTAPLLPIAQITCLTVVGAGKGLAWFVTIDGQNSVSPTTAYGVPVINWFSGPGAVDASTDGGDAVTLYGRFFSTQQFLGAVTYGATGTEYVAQNCSVAQNHVAITCFTTRGTGRFLRWSVTVGGQTSAASVNFTSYAAPRITSLIPNKLLTNGDVAAVITGTDFAARWGAASVRIYLNNFNSAMPSQAFIDSYTAQAMLGYDPRGVVNAALAQSSVQSWLASLTAIVPLVQPLPATSAGTLSFLLPGGFGPSQSAIVVVDGVPSNIVNFS